MRTTIDIPDSLFRQMKARAALRGETLKEAVLRAVRADLMADESLEKKAARVALPIVKSQETTYDVSPDALAELLDSEDRE